MKALIVLAALLAARLVLAAGAWAQEAPATGGPVPPRLEIGGTVGAVWFEPSVGVLASVGASPRSSVEGGVNMSPYFVFTQAQVRVRLPWGPTQGARRSLVAGLTHLSRRSKGVDRHGGLAAHVGMSAQAPLSRRLDLRADLQMLMPFRAGPNADPRAVVAFAWHR
jgi:hypothetical protein